MLEEGKNDRVGSRRYKRCASEFKRIGGNLKVKVKRTPYLQDKVTGNT
jgi:hypothetical protein